MIEWGVLHAEIVRVDGVACLIPNRPRQVLLRLLLEANTTVAVDQLADSLWHEGNLPKSPRNALSRFVSDLREALGDYGVRVQTTSIGYLVIVEPGELDIDRLTTTMARYRSENSDGTTTPDVAQELQAIAKEIGPRPNPHLDGLHNHDAVGRSHGELRIGLYEAIADNLYEEQQFAELVAQLEQLVAEHPYHERFWNLLVLSLDAVGRPRDALSACERLDGLLAEIGVVASQPLLQIETEIRARQAGAPTPTAPTQPAPGHTVPATAQELGDSAAPAAVTDPGTSLVGRVDDLRKVYNLMQKHRLVTIVGLGGTGKTRLALGVADALGANDTPVHRLSLRSIDDPGLLVPLAAASLGVPSAGEISAVELAETVARQNFVLILDNCEHLPETCRDLTAALLEHCPNARILATSRTTLEAPGEIPYLLAPLALDPTGGAEQSHAVDLFIDRAGLALPIDSPDADRVDHICRRLNGLPLSIEIAAAQLAFMTLEQLEDRIDSAISRNDADYEPAVAASYEVLDWAWKNLSPSQQALIARLSVFASGWTEASARTVRAGPGSITADLERLVAASLVTMAPAMTSTSHGDHPSQVEVRFAMLPPVREYAAARLEERGEKTIMRDRLAAWALERVDKHSLPEHHVLAEPSRQLRPEYGNITVALNHLFAAERHEQLLSLAVGASGMMVNRGLASSVIRWITPYIDDESIDRELRSAACFALGTALHATGDVEGLSEVGVKGVELANGAPVDWMAAHAGYLSVWSVVAPAGRSTNELSQISSDAADQSISRELNQGVVALYRAHIEFVSRNYDEALTLFRKAKGLVKYPGRGLLVIEIGETLSLYMLERHDEARTSIGQWRSRNDTDHWHYILDVFRAIVIGGTGDPEQATVELAAAMRTMPEAGAWGQAGAIQTAFAMLADFRGEHELAIELFSSAPNRDIMLLSVAINHVMKTRGLAGDDAWLEVGLEFWTRIVPEHSVAATSTSTPQLLQWWVSGQVD